ncbi:MAG: hypothetical protein ACP5IE_06760 [Infirmifilum sp.]
MNEFKELFDTYYDDCDMIECPTCRAFCKDWIKAGKTLYKVINEEATSDDEKVTLIRVKKLMLDVVNDE